MDRDFDMKTKTVKSRTTPWRAWIMMLLPPLYVSWRIYWAARMPIMDCDEVYNYWEPLAFVLFQDGNTLAANTSTEPNSSMQTWEYAHEYALRTFAYLFPLAQAAPWVRLWVGPEQPWLRWLVDHEVPTNKVATFVGLRILLAALTGTAEVTWLRALLSARQQVSFYVVMYTGLIMLTAAGMNHAAGEYLPSATWMATWLVCSAAFLHEYHHVFCVVAVSATLAIGWPFGVVMLIPMGLRILWKHAMVSITSLIRLLAFILVITLVVQAIVMQIDHYYYGAWVSPTLNIFTYNAAGGGDELYGTEPVTYYIKNLFLNLGLAAPLGVVVLPMLIFTQLREVDLVVLFVPLYLWFAITFPRPHKEERFLYPVYPLLCFGAVLTVDKVGNYTGRLVSGVSRHKELMNWQRHLMHLLVVVVTVIFGLLRTAALVKYYSAPLHIFATLSTHLAGTTVPANNPTLVCTCGEWHRFPSSFFLPPGSELAFLESSFKGQLPQPFSPYGSRPESQQVLQPFNDQNKEEPARYTALEKCDWIVDLDDGTCASPQDTVPVHSVPFLDAARTQALHRILYIPYLHEKAVAGGQVHFQNYVLYKVNRVLEE